MIQADTGYVKYIFRDLKYKYIIIENKYYYSIYKTNLNTEIIHNKKYKILYDNENITNDNIALILNIEKK